MYKILLIILICITSDAIEPYKKITIQNIITSIDLYNDELYISSDLGIVEVYNINNSQKIKEIKLEKIYDYFGDSFYPKIFSTHTIDGKNILIVSQDSNGSSKIQIHNNQGLKTIQLNNTSFINKAYFIDKDRILIGLLSNEIILYSLKSDKILWILQPSQAVFSDLIFKIESYLEDNEAYKQVVENCYKIAKQSHNSKDCTRYMLKTASKHLSFA